MRKILFLYGIAYSILSIFTLALVFFGQENDRYTVIYLIAPIFFIMILYLLSAVLSIAKKSKWVYIFVVLSIILSLKIHTHSFIFDFPGPLSFYFLYINKPCVEVANSILGFTKNCEQHFTFPISYSIPPYIDISFRSRLNQDIILGINLILFFTGIYVYRKERNKPLETQTNKDK